jgi:hypothetical protein
MLMPTETDYAPNQNQTKPNQTKSKQLVCSAAFLAFGFGGEQMQWY